MGKLITLFLFVIGGVGYVLTRVVITGLNKRSTHAIINSIRKDPSKAMDVSASLDLPYSKKENFSSDHFERLKNYIQSIPIAGSYLILYSYSFDPDHLLVFTEISFTDYDIDVTGRNSDTQKKAYHNFVLRLDREKNILVILSDNYSDTTEKFQKEGFMNAVFKGA